MLIANLLIFISFIAPHRFYVGFRYALPLTEMAVESLLQDKVDRAIAFTQYPQYSCSTTGSSLCELYRNIKKHDPNNTIPWKIIDRWGTNPLLVKVFFFFHKKKLKLKLITNNN